MNSTCLDFTNVFSFSGSTLIPVAIFGVGGGGSALGLLGVRGGIISKVLSSNHMSEMI